MWRSDKQSSKESKTHPNVKIPGPFNKLGSRILLLHEMKVIATHLKVDTH
jgi:hypothetical protein